MWKNLHFLDFIDKISALARAVLLFTFLPGSGAAITSTSPAWKCGQSIRGCRARKRRWSALCAGRTLPLWSRSRSRWKMQGGSSLPLKERSQTGTWEFCVAAAKSLLSLANVSSKHMLLIFVCIMQYMAVILFADCFLMLNNSVKYNFPVSACFLFPDAWSAVTCICVRTAKRKAAIHSISLLPGL